MQFHLIARLIVPPLIDIMSNDSSMLFKYDDVWEMLVAAKQNKTTDASIRPYLDYWMGNLCLINKDTLGAINHYKEASKFKEWGKELNYTIGILHYTQKDFKKAYKLFIQIADEQHPWTFNQLAYMYARGEYVKQSFEEAMKYVDLAISNAPTTENLANYYDSKGEIFLMMGEIDEAKEYWNKVLEVYPNFNVETSDLYRELCKLYLNEHETKNDIESNDTIGETRKIQLSKEQLQDYVHIVQLVAGAEYNLSEYTNSSLLFIDYEEFVSIGIIAVQVLINNITPEQLEKYSIFYIATAVRWAIRNELRIRYNWYKLHSLDRLSDDERMIDEINSELQKLMVRANIYSTVYEMYKQLDNRDFERVGSEKVEQDVFSMWETINEGIENLSEKEQRIAKSLIEDDFGFGKTMSINKVTIEECAIVIEKIRQYLKDKGVKG